MDSITLSAEEIHLAASHGLMRRFIKHKGLIKDRMQKEQSSWDNEIEGACAELALCRYRGIFWSGASKFKGKDAGDVEVRWTKHIGTGGLIVYPHDEDGAVFILMDGFAPTYNIIGWLRGIEAKKPEYLTGFGYLVPRDKVRKWRKEG